MQVQDLDTPALIVDLDIMEANLRRVAAYCAEHRLRLRPHTKTHKSPFLARQQLALGAAGLTVAKVGEAEVMVSAMPGATISHGARRSRSAPWVSIEPHSAV